MNTTMLESILSRFYLENKRPMGGINLADSRFIEADASNRVMYYSSLLDEDSTSVDSTTWEAELDYWEGVLDAL